ncbi:uncharacterized protein RHOBADRAFT_32925 [Rhodotorula graminis WP1]|uniref:2-(3-amino-3-carboxypropyl)histidine synthase subunit 1 n=1 Tax=Rhodotorula graminis (strain WP1) TaxID=578459 RepID=A0A194SC24_RHOGW|nr:uncharacterized protein RHOBADRAFT_32925 [Rhodotorula graminis WP1]KPV78283.1 hypothetical protein RHOBADRAFT_32925 [Rhodotorula graminis WP1]
MQPDTPPTASEPAQPKPARKRFVGRSSTSSRPPASSNKVVAASALQQQQQQPVDPLLEAAIHHLLPSNYNFEIPKSVAQILRNRATRVALQMPEGLAMYGCAIVDILERFTGAECVIMGDVTYGACCIDDYTARALGCDMMIHYGHSCLVPVDTTTIKTLYVFVEIGVDRQHLAGTVRLNFPTCIPPRGAGALASGASGEGNSASSEVAAASPRFEVVVPQVKPLSPGEILGCTAPKLAADTDALLYVGDGRFHLESIMIQNPLVPAFRYDPYTKRLTRELYDHAEMREVRGQAVARARDSLSWAVVLGTLGRQGNLRVLKSVTRHLDAPPATSSTMLSTTTPSSTSSSTPFIPILLSELSPAKLSLLQGISTFVQTSCPRLSIDWGYAFSRPLLSPYEAAVALGVDGARGWKDMGRDAEQRGLEGARKGDEDYPMDFYSDKGLGEWTPRFGMGARRAGGEKGRPVPRSKRAAAAVAVPAP